MVLLLLLRYNHAHTFVSSTFSRGAPLTVLNTRRTQPPSEARTSSTRTVTPPLKEQGT